MVEDVLHPKEFEGKGDQKDVIGRIAALNHLKSPAKIDPPREEELPKQGATEFPYVTQGAVPFPGHGVPVNMDPFGALVSFLVTFALWAQYGYFVSVAAQGASLLPHAGIEWNGKVFYNDENFLLHNWDLVAW
jgi:hypothetical protein